MSHANHDALARELARTLGNSLERALALESTSRSAQAARDAAQVLGLKGLDRALDTLLVQAARPWDSDLLPILDRLRLLVSESSGRTLEFFQALEPEFEAMASNVEAIEAGSEAAARQPGIKALRLSQVLDDVPLADEATRERARRVRVTAPVAAALRAAIDWLSHDNGSPAPLRFTSEESVLEVVCDRANVLGLRSAEKVLAAVGGVLFPASASGTAVTPLASGAWVLRVPTLAGMGSYLMLHQGDLALALPWHSVLRLYMGRGIDVRGGFGERGLSVLPPFAALALNCSEYPVVLVGHGLKRAYMVADHLVWRLRGEPIPAESPSPFAGLSGMVRTEDGERYWVADPARLLEPLESPAVPLSPRTSEAARTPAPPALGPEDVSPLPAAEVQPAEPPRAQSIPDEPTAEAPVESAAPTPPPAPTPHTTRAPGPRGAPGRALVAEDSITARIFLTRMLEQSGLNVRAVPSATELLDEIVDDGWSLIFLDVELPDRRDLDVMSTVVARLSSRGLAIPIVALVRDEEDIASAKAAGIDLVLHKPFVRRELDRLLVSVGLDPGDVR